MNTENTKRDIQLHILTRLLSALSLRYTEARPLDTPNDLYNYHLQFLVKKGLVKKEKNKYSLTAAGIKYVAETRPLSPSGIEPDRFKVNVWTIVFKKEKGKLMVLNQLRRRHPFYGETGIMGGSVKKGESIAMAAKRKLREETGLEADFKLVGVVRKMIFQNGNELFSDILFYVCISHTSSGDLRPRRHLATMIGLRSTAL